MPAPVITFKAGICEVDDSTKPFKVFPKPEPGFLYIFKEDDLPHFCWRPRSSPLSEPILELIMFPGDGTFQPLETKTSDGKPLVNGRVFVLRFSSSSQRHFFWLQSKSQHSSGDSSWFSPRDRKLGEIVNQLLQGEEVNVHRELANVPTGGGDGGDDDDTAMEDADAAPFGADHHRAASGGAGAGATGGDIREEGEESREGGADGGRAAAAALPSLTQGNPETRTAVANFLASLQSSSLSPQAPQNKVFTTLVDLLPPSAAIPALTSSSNSPPISTDEQEINTAYLDTLLTHLPPALTLLSSGTPLSQLPTTDLDPDEFSGILLSLPTSLKLSIISKVLRSPQFSQALTSLTSALRDGGLPSIAEALGVPIEGGGLVPGGTVPIGGGDAVEAFVKGIRKGVEGEKDETQGGGDGGAMETD